MKAGKSKTVILHIVGWLMFSVAWFFSVEPLLNILAAGFSNVAMWVFAEIAGTALIFIIIALSLLVNVSRR